jgi:hypothetical protein
VQAPLGHHHAVAGGGLEGGAIHVGVVVGWIADQGKAAVVAADRWGATSWWWAWLMPSAAARPPWRSEHHGPPGEILEANIRPPSSIASVGLGPWCHRAAPKPRSAR